MSPPSAVLGIDLGATNTKLVILSPTIRSKFWTRFPRAVRMAPTR